MSPLDNKIPALPEIDVNGVRKSCEMERSKFARNCSFLARIAAFSLSFATFSFSKANAHSPKIESIMLFSNSSKGSSSMTMPTTPYTLSFIRIARYKHFALDSVPVVAPAL